MEEQRSKEKERSNENAFCQLGKFFLRRLLKNSDWNILAKEMALTLLVYESPNPLAYGAFQASTLGDQQKPFVM